WLGRLGSEQSGSCAKLVAGSKSPDTNTANANLLVNRINPHLHERGGHRGRLIPGLNAGAVNSERDERWSWWDASDDRRRGNSTFRDTEAIGSTDRPVDRIVLADGVAPDRVSRTQSRWARLGSLTRTVDGRLYRHGSALEFRRPVRREVRETRGPRSVATPR